VTFWLVCHIASAFWFVAGLAGRDVTLARARISADIAAMKSLTDAAGVFDKRMVIPGSMAVLVFGLVTAFAGGWSFSDNGWLLLALVLYLSLIPLVPLVFLPRGKVFDAAMEDAVSKGEATPALREALADRAVLGARWYERIVVAVIIVLMITKPF
jgi:Predicted integral membrane protein (DUF2269)